VVAGSYDSFLSIGGLPQASDGVVALSSASLDFASPGRTRIIDYCHVPLTPGVEADYLGCIGPGIALVDTPSHPTYQIVSSFLLNDTAWQGIGNAPAQDQYLSTYGGMVVADVTPADQFVSDLSGVSWGSLNLSNGGASGELYYSDFVRGEASFAFGSSTCGPFTEIAGIYSAVPCKYGPSVYSVGPLLLESSKVVQAGTTITILGAGFGALQCAACGVTGSNPQFTQLQISSWSDTTIQAFLPATFGGGIAQLGVTTASGYAAINIMAGVAATPTISLSSSLNFAFTVDGAAPEAQSVSVANTGGGNLTYSVTSSAAWLIATASGASIAVSINPAGLTANTYQGAITVTSPTASNSPQTVAVTLVVMNAQVIVISSVRNSATGLPGPIAPGELISIFGMGLGPNTSTTFSVNPANNTVASTLAGTRVFFGSTAAPVLYASSTQVNVIAPYEIAGQTQVTIRVQCQGVVSAGTGIQVASASPGAFTLDSSGSGPVVAENQDGTINTPTNPAAEGSYVTIYFTGGGETNPPGVTGSVTGSVLNWLAQPILVTVGGTPATVSFDGAAPSFVEGVNQLNIRLAPGTPSGAQPIMITIGGISSPSTVTLGVQ
jgi:uncharacterized protein (TIGR03437 family)